MMDVIKPALTLAILMSSLVCGNAWGEPGPAVPAAKPASAPVAPPKKPPLKRRAVQQIVDGMPAAPVYAPTLTPPPPPPTLPSTLPSGMAPPPAAISACGAGGCRDTSGRLYNGASGTLLSPQGRLCSSNGVTINCI